MIYLFVDDKREVNHIYTYRDFEAYKNEFLNDAKDKWVIIRSFNAFVSLVNALDHTLHRFVISLDHDLGTEKDGHDILKYCIEQNKIPQEVFFHSANWTAVKEMQSYWDSYKKSLLIKENGIN